MSEDPRRSGFALGSLWCSGASFGGSSGGRCLARLCGGGEFCLYPFLGADNLGLEVVRRVGFAFRRQGRVGLEEVVKVLMNGKASASSLFHGFKGAERAQAYLEHLLEFGFLCGLDPCPLDVEDVGRLVDRHAVVPRDGIDVARATSRSSCCCSTGRFTACSCVCEKRRRGGGQLGGKGPDGEREREDDDSLRAACRHAWTTAFPRICEPRMTTCAITRGADCRRNRVEKKVEEERSVQFARHQTGGGFEVGALPGTVPVYESSLVRLAMICG